jgi:GAF domain-containing protein
VRSYFGVPLLADGSAIGILQVDSPEPDAWTEEQREIFLAVAPIVASAIQNARSHARAESARVQSSASGRRLQEARQLVMSLRTAQQIGDHGEAERLLVKLEAVLGAVPEVERGAPRMPQQRITVA